MELEMRNLTRKAAVAAVLIVTLLHASVGKTTTSGQNESPITAKLDYKLYKVRKTKQINKG